MSSGRVRTKVEKTGEIVAYSEAAVRNNAAMVEYCRTSMAALSGSTAGLLGLTGFLGFGFYVFAVVELWALLLFKAGSHWKKYFINRRTLLTNGFFGGLFHFLLLAANKCMLAAASMSMTLTETMQTYVLFWTFIYGMVHVY